jgi:hypothetical protein
MTKERNRRWNSTLNNSMPVALDTIGLMLLSGSAMMWSLIAGTAAAGVSFLVVSGRHFSR